MTRVDLQNKVMAALVDAKPASKEAALSVALGVLTAEGAQREAGEFSKWFEKNGDWLTQKVSSV